MDITFITIHDLSPEAIVLYASDSIGDVLGHQPRDVVGRSCFEYFHPDEEPFARDEHSKGLLLDCAAMLSYCTLKRVDGVYVRCECVFTVVYSVIVACTSLYRFTEKSVERANVAPSIRAAFSTDKDPRYSMLTHLSSKFTTPYYGDHEPRAALFLNRFTRTLSIMYATHAIGDILGVSAEDALGRSFFECISEDCLQDAVDALERAKENDSIAYLRFHWRDPRIGNGERSPSAEDEEEDDEAEDEEEDEDQDDEDDAAAAATGNRNSSSSRTPVNSAITASSPSDDEQPDPEARSASTPQSSVSANTVAEVEVEAVVSCTSDGLVVILRKARGPRLPAAGAAGVFASPWAHTPLLPAQQAPSSGVPAHDFMESIRQVAVFAWSLRSINGEIMQHAQPGPKPDSSEKVGDFSKPGTTHWKRSREWEVAFGDRNAQLAEAERDSQYPDSDDEGKDKDLRHSNKKRVRGDDDA